MVKPQPDKPRLIAWEVFRAVQLSEIYSHVALPQRLKESQLDSRDKAFITELVYGSLRMQGHADFLIDQVSNKPLLDLDEDVVDLLRFSIYQVIHMRIPNHASVSTNVELARKVIGESKGSFVNALLRKISSKSLESWLRPVSEIEDPIKRLALQHSHPEWIVSAYFDQLKDISEVNMALESNNQAAVPTLIAWPDEISREELIEEGGEATPYSSYGVKSAKPPFEYLAVRKRKAAVQDEGSQIVAEFFYRSLKSPKKILDTCAGPGGKAALISRLSRRDGASFTANEFSEVRADLVRQVVPYGDIRVGDARDIDEKFDGIISDVPCSGIGALRRRPEVRWKRTSADLKNLIPLQQEIAMRSLANLNPGGVLGYATCSPHLLETRAVVDYLLRKNPDCEEIEVSSLIPNSHNGKSLQLWTHRHNTDAMFLALIRKKDTL